MMIDTILKLKLMTAFAKSAKPRFGQELACDLGYSQGKVSIALDELFKAGYLNCYYEQVIPNNNYKPARRKYFQINREGKKEVKNLLKELNLKISPDGILNSDDKPFGYESFALIKVFSTLSRNNDFMPAPELLAATKMRSSTLYVMCNKAIDLGLLEWRYSNTFNKQNKQVTEYSLNQAGRDAIQIEVGKCGLSLS